MVRGGIFAFDRTHEAQPGFPLCGATAGSVADSDSSALGCDPVARKEDDTLLVALLALCI